MGKQKNNPKIIKKGLKKNQTKKKILEQDLHPDWDRLRGTMLYPLSCGELTVKESKFKNYM